MIDLHLHSNNSDGLDSPSKLIDIALNSDRNLKAIALTDHDSIDGLAEFMSCGEDKRIITIPGIEISIQHQPERGFKDIHIVGLNIDYTSNELISALKKQLRGRIEQKERICDRLREEFNFKISFNEVKNLAGSYSLGRPHIIEVLINNNPKRVKEYTKNELFKLISIGGEAYVFREFELNLGEAINLIEAAGGIPILAHPGIYEVKDRKKFLEMCIEFGIKGLEIEYTYSKNRPYNNTENAEWVQEFLPNYYRQLAERHDLLKSGGSDYHGGKKGINIGEANVPDKYLKSFI
ncbi:MAG: PHP domain-containing protein [Promethearchaeota archaeon]